MKTKFIYLFIMILAVFTLPSISYSQVQVGNGTNLKTIPVHAWYNYSYSQQIYLASEIVVSGTITELKFDFNGSTLSNSNDWTIWIGHTSKTSFSSKTDWIPVANMTQVYSSTFADPGGSGWITLDITDWTYNGSDNIVIAIDENSSACNGSGDKFNASSVSENRAIYYYSDGTNPDPVSPPTASYNIKYIANIIFGGLTPPPPPPTSQNVTDITTTDAKLNWTSGGASNYNVEYGPDGFTKGTGTLVAVATDEFLVITGLTPEDTYEWYVQDSVGTGNASSWTGPNSFTTLATCPPPTAQIVTGVTSTGAQLNWTTGGATDFGVEYGPTGFTKGMGTYIAVTTDEFKVLTGLTEGTTYEWYVHDSCGTTDVSLWVGPNSFSTAYLLPYYQDFSSYLPTSWTEKVGRLETNSTLTGTSSAWKSDGFGNVGSTGAVSVNIYNTTKKEWIISPSIDLSGGGNNYLDFDIALTNYNSTGDDDMGVDDSLAVVISIDNGLTWDKANIIKLWTATSDKPSTSGEHVYIDLSSYSTVVKIGFYAVSTIANKDYDMHIDNFKVSVANNNDIKIASIIGEYAGYGQGNYTVQAVVENSGTAVQTSIPLNFMVEGGAVVSEVMPTLAAFTTDTFTFTAKAQSSATADTLLLSVYSTLSNDEDNTNDTATYFGVINMDLPYIDDFESYSTNSTPQYWSVLNLTENSSAYAKVASNSSYSHSGTKYLHMYNSTVVDATKPLIASFPITNFDVSSFRLEFWLSGTDSKLYIGVMSDPMDETTFTLIDSIMPTSSNVLKAVMFDTYTGNGKYVAFKHGMTTTSDHLNIDDIKLYAPVANEITVTNVIGSYVGFGQGDFTVQAVVKNNGSAAQTSIPLNFMVEGGAVVSEVMPTLAAFTTDTFTFSAKAQSSATADTLLLAVYSTLSSDGDASNDTAYTDIVTLGMPYMEGFEDYAYGATPNYWTINNYTGSSSAYAKVYSSNTHTGSRSFAMYNYNKTGNDKALIAVLPKVNSGLTSLRMEFWLKGGGSDMIIGVMDDPNDTATFVAVETLTNPPTSYNEYAIMFDTYAGSGKYIAFKHGLNTTYDNFYFDDIELFVPPTNDLSVESIITPNSTACGNSNDSISIIVKNLGTDAQSGVLLKADITNPDGTVTNLNTTISIASFSTDTFYIMNFDSQAIGEYDISAYTDLSNDEDNNNDTSNYSFEIYPIIAVDYIDGFENTPLYWAATSGWSISTTHGKTGKGLYKNFYGSGSTAAGYAYMTRKLGPIPAGASLNFDYRLIEYTSYPNNALTMDADSFLFMLSTDCGNSFDTIYVVDSATHVTSTDWAHRQIDLSAYAGQNVIIKVEGKRTAEDYYFDLDNYGIATPPSVDLGPDTAICIGVPVDIDAGGSTSGYSYEWTNNGYANVIATSQVIDPDSAGTYVVVVTAPMGTATDTIIVSTNALPTVATFTTDEICTGDDATLAASFTGATPWSFSYTKDVNDTTDVTDVASPWTSTFAVTDTAYFTIIGIKDGNGCISTTHSDTIAVNVNPLPVVAIASLSDVCANENVFTYTQGSGPVGGSGYYSGTAVDSASSTFNAVAAGAGSHTITYTYTDSNACVNSTSGIQIVNALPNITAAATDNPVPYNATTTLTASVSNAVGAISYAWTPSGNITETDTTTASLTTTAALSTVNYYVKVTDAGNTCTTWDTIVLPYSGGPVSVAPTSNPTAICSGDAATLSSGTSGGSGTVTYVWTSNPVGFNSTIENPSVSPTVDTWFIVAATDDVLTTKDSVLITIIADPAISYAVDTTFACFGSDAEAIVNITGLAPFSYTYNGIITNATNNTDTVLLNAAADATYKLSSVTDANGCTATSDFDSIVVSAWVLPLAVASADATICYGDSTEISIDLTGVSPWSFDVFDGNSTMNVASATSPFTVFADPDSTVKYTIVSVTDGHSCNTTANIDSITVFVNQLATATVSDNDTMCIGDSVQLAINFNGAAPYTFNVTDGTNPMSFTSANDIFNVYVGPDATTTYTLTTITDDNGCIANNLTEATEVFVNPLPTAPTFTGLAADYCEDASVVTLVGAPTGGLFSGSGITASDFDPSSAASGANDIEYRITDANGCENFVINSTTINTLPSITISGLASAYCVDAPAATLTATPTGSGGVWSGAVNASVEFEASVSGVGSHTVYYEFTDANGCVNNDSATTTVNALPVVAVTTLADVCFDEPNFMPIGATPVGGTWTGAGVNANYFNATTAGAGSHYLTYTFTDANGCVDFDSTTQMVNALPVLTVTGLATAYCANDDADTLMATPAGGTYYGTGLSGGIFSPSNANVGSNSMLYMFTDANGCFNSYTATTMVNAIPTVSLASASTVCVNGSMTLDAGADGTSYIWNTGATTQTITADTSGYGVGTFTYSVDVTNADGCSNNGTTDITYEALPLSQLGDTSTICGENADITLDAGYVPGNTYVWSNGSSWSSITINSNDLGGNTGTMSVEITSEAGCITNDQTYVYFREEPTIDLGGDQIVCVNHEFTIDAGAGFTSYLWNTGASTQSITIDSNTFNVGNNTISVEVYNDVNCNASDSMVLVVDPCTGVATPELDKVSISVYPNPTSGQFQIDVAGLENQEYNLDVYNSVGAVVFTDKIVYEGLDTKTWKLDFSSFAKGVYHIRLHSNGDIKVERVVIQ